MDSFNILHLSDLQFGDAHSILAPPASEFSSHHPQLGKRILEALQKENVPRPHVVVLSGDIAQRGFACEFDSAFGFTSELHDLLARTFGEQPDWVIVPGNHDVNWEASSANSAASQSERTSAMLVEFKTFCARFQYYLESTGARLYQPFDLACKSVFKLAILREPPFEVIIAPLDSCEREGHLPRQHYGYISDFQLKHVESSLALAKSPYSLQIAVLHHHPGLSSPGPQELQAKFSKLLSTEPGLDPSKISNLSGLLAAASGNHLVEPERVLRKLALLGFQLVLHGHQHYDGPIHVQYPVEDENPFGHGGLSMMAAGSIGIGPGGDQPSAPSFQFYRIQRDHFGWKVASDRFRLSTIGFRAPSIDIQKDQAMSWHCYSTRPRKVLGGLCNFLTPGPTKDSAGQTTAVPKYTLADSFAWGHCFMEGVHPTLSLGCAPERLLIRRHSHDRLKPSMDKVIENASGVLAGVANVLTRQKVYADLDVWGLASAAAGTGRFLATLDVKKTNFLPYIALNMQMGEPSMKPLRDKVSSLLNAKCSELTTLDAFLSFAKERLSTRFTLQVLIQVKDGAQHFVLLKRRSTNVSHLEGVIQFSVAGGFKCALNADHPGLEGWLLSALREETLLETGIRIPSDSFKIMCITVTSLEYSPILTAVATITAQEANLRCEVDAATTPFEGFMLVPGELYLPKTPVRDWWEGCHFIKGLLPPGTSLVSSDIDKAEAAWRQLQQCWEVNENKNRGSMDPVPGAAIHAVLRAISSSRSGSKGTSTAG